MTTPIPNTRKDSNGLRFHIGSDEPKVDYSFDPPLYYYSGLREGAVLRRYYEQRRETKERRK